MGAVLSFRDLHVYQKAYSLSLEVHKVSLDFPKMEQYALADQMRRASKSICANIAEGFGRQHASTSEFRRYVTIAIGSSDEMKVWTDYARDLGYLDLDRAGAWQAAYSEIARMLHGLKDGRR